MTIGSQSTLGGFDPIGGQEAENIARSSSSPEVYQVTVAVVFRACSKCISFGLRACKCTYIMHVR